MCDVEGGASLGRIPGRIPGTRGSNLRLTVLTLPGAKSISSLGQAFLKKFDKTGLGFRRALSLFLACEPHPNTFAQLLKNWPTEAISL
jgi:hypothetical protein